MARRAPLATLSVALLLAVAGGACGGGDQSSAGSTGSPSSSRESVLKSGEESSRAELAQAAGELRGFFALVAARDWNAACAEMADATIERLEELSRSRPQLPDSCAAILAKLARLHSARTLRADARMAEFRSLRVDGDSAFAVYRGHGGVLLAMPMVSEDGAWKPAALVGTPVG